EAGWTAFYVLTTEDCATLLKAVEPGAWRRGSQTSNPEMAEVRQRMSMLEMGGEDEVIRRVATCHLAVARPAERAKRSLLSSLTGGVIGGSRRKDSEKPLYIPIDGPRDIDYATMQSPICEGE